MPLQPPSPSPKPRRPRKRKRETVDQRLMRYFPVVVRYSGIVMGFYEMRFEHSDRPAIIALAGSMMAGSFIVEVIRRDR